MAEEEQLENWVRVQKKVILKKEFLLNLVLKLKL